MRPTKGIHLVVDAKKLPVPQPTYFDTGKQDGRMVFAIPRENKLTLVRQIRITKETLRIQKSHKKTWIIYWM